MNYKEIGPRAKQVREKAGLTLDQVAEKLAMPNVTVQDLTNFENGDPLAAVVLVKLALDVYKCHGCQLHELLYGPYPYQSSLEWITAYMKGEITEGTLASGLQVGRLEARCRVQEYQQANDV